MSQHGRLQTISMPQPTGVLTDIWEPRPSFSGSSANVDYSSSGTYKKIGPLVIFDMRMQLNELSAASGTLSIVDIPFTIDNEELLGSLLSWDSIQLRRGFFSIGVIANPDDNKSMLICGSGRENDAYNLPAEELSDSSFFAHGFYFTTE